MDVFVYMLYYNCGTSGAISVTLSTHMTCNLEKNTGSETSLAPIKLTPIFVSNPLFLWSLKLIVSSSMPFQCTLRSGGDM